jgi:hypothetical protein
MPKPMYVTAEWIEAHCVIPDQESRGEPFLLGNDQLKFVLSHYTVKDDAVAAGLKVAGRIVKGADAFVARRSQLVRAQKWGKSPLVSAFVCLEGVGPAVFAGFASEGDVYDCRDHGCGCGWVYEYELGEPMGRPWATPLIQITATTEDQTDNTYDALRPMIELGPLSDVIPKTGEEFIRLPNGGRIDAVTSKGNSRLGQRVTFVVQDETGLWLETNGGWNLAKKQRQGLAGMGGRAIETTNAWNPADNSVAQRTFESKSKDVNKDFEQPPAHLDFKKKADRAKIFAFNYRAAPWVSLSAVEGEAAEMLETSPADAERFFGNRIVSGSGSWMDMPKWVAKKAVPQVIVQPRTRVCLGFDGSDNNDFTGIRLETLDQFQFTPTYGVNELPTLWEPAEWGGRIPKAEVNAAMDELANRFEIVRAYCDPQFWESDIDQWAYKYGERVFVEWRTNRIVQMHSALERQRGDVYDPDSKFRHDGDARVEVHFRNAIVRSRALNPLTKERQYILGKPTDPQKFDYAMSSVLAHEAVMDAIADGALGTSENYVYF